MKKAKKGDKLSTENKVELFKPKEKIEVQVK